MADQEIDAGNGGPLAEGDSTLPEEGITESYEELQSQLQEMEKQQEQMAAELEQVNGPQLDSNLAVIEEQFRQSFDERFAATPKPRLPKTWEDQTEVLRTNNIFREVSRALGDEWRPIFNELTVDYPADVVEAERAMVESQQQIIQGYKALNAWKEISGRNFSIMRLVDVLRNNNMDDVADDALNILDDRVKPNSKDNKSKPVQRRKSDVSSRTKSNALDNRRMLLIAKKIGGDWEPLGKELGIPDEELAEVKESEGTTYQGTFKVLWAWRQLQGAGEGGVEVLKAALEKIGKKHVADAIEA